TLNVPFSPPTGPGCLIPYTYTITAVADNGTLTITLTGTDTNNVLGMSPPACSQTFTSLSGTTVHTMTYNIATGAFQASTTDNYSDTSFDSQNSYSTSVTGSGSASGVWPIGSASTLKLTLDKSTQEPSKSQSTLGGKQAAANKVLATATVTTAH